MRTEHWRWVLVALGLVSCAAGLVLLPWLVSSQSMRDWAWLGPALSWRSHPGGFDVSLSNGLIALGGVLLLISWIVSRRQG